MLFFFYVVVVVVIIINIVVEVETFFIPRAMGFALARVRPADTVQALT